MAHLMHSRTPCELLGYSWDLGFPHTHALLHTLSSLSPPPRNSLSRYRFDSPVQETGGSRKLEFEEQFEASETDPALLESDPYQENMGTYGDYDDEE